MLLPSYLAANKEAHVEYPEPDSYEKRLKRSVKAILVTMFLSSMGFTICIPSLWLYFSHFDECRCHSTMRGNAHRSLMVDFKRNISFETQSAFRNIVVPADLSASPAKVVNTTGCSAGTANDEAGMCKEKRSCNKFSGMIVAAFPLAQLIFSPLIGYWGSRRPVKEVISITLCIMSCGYVAYSLAWDRWTLFFARFLVGSGAGNGSVLRYYTNGAMADPHKRTGVIAQISGAQSLGFVLGPCIGYFLADLFRGQQAQPLPGVWPGLILDEYTAPGYLSAVLCLLNVGLIYTCIEELKETCSPPPPAGPQADEDDRRLWRQSPANTPPAAGTPPPPPPRCWADDDTHWPPAGGGAQDHLRTCGPTPSLLLPSATAAGAADTPIPGAGKAALAAAAAAGGGESPAASPLDGVGGGGGGGAAGGDGWRTGVCIVVMFTTIVMMFSMYEGVGTQISECTMGWGVTENGRFLAAMGACALAAMAGLRRLSAAAGGDDWRVMVAAYGGLVAAQVLLCDWSPPLPLWQWVAGGVCLAVSFPVAQAMLYVILSKEVPRRRQGLMMGYLMSGGSLARMIGPPAATWAYSAGGFRTYPLFLGAVGVMLCPLALVLFWGPAGGRRRRPAQQPDPRLVVYADGGRGKGGGGRACGREFPEEMFGAAEEFEVEQLLEAESVGA